MSGAVLEIRGLEVVLSGQTILDGVNLSLEPGTIHALLGPNGAGKTTLIRCVVGSLAHRGRSVSGFAEAAASATCRSFSTSIMPFPIPSRIFSRS
ncbi:MAG: ATP-binding cassette domain-containing protein [Deltaproteobacteria bacterium]|nr:ATP-binding cassette domain-containing protein [Deltaproteobacteria bacterium]